MVWRRIQAQRVRGRAFQPRFRRQEVLAPWLGGLLAIASLAQPLRCLHPPAGAVALLGVLFKAQPGFVGLPMRTGSLLLTLLAVLFNRPRPGMA